MVALKKASSNRRRPGNGRGRAATSNVPRPMSRITSRSESPMPGASRRRAARSRNIAIGRENSFIIEGHPFHYRLHAYWHDVDREHLAAEEISMEHAEPTVRDAVLLCVTRAHERLSPEGLARLLALRAGPSRNGLPEQVTPRRSV